MSVNPDGDSEGPCEAEVGNLDGAALVDQQVLRLQISMKNATLMAKKDSLNDLIGVALDQPWIHHLAGWNRGVEVLLQVHRQVLEDQVQPEKDEKICSVIVWADRCMVTRIVKAVLGYFSLNINIC